MTVRHIVVWKLAASDETERAEALATIRGGLTGLIGAVPSIGTLTVAVNGAYPETNSDVVLVAEFADYAALEAYQTHPAHLEVAAKVRSLVSGRAAIDYEY